MKTEQDDKTDEVVTSRQRVQIALRHKEPDRIPVDFLATPEVWAKLVTHFQPNLAKLESSEFFSPEREAVLQQLEIDCRLISYDMFCAPPESALKAGSTIDWWYSLARSTPNRMWRQLLPDEPLEALEPWKGAKHRLETRGISP